MCMPGAFGGQKRVSELQGCERPCRCWKSKSGFLQEQLVLLNAEQSLCFFFCLCNLLDFFTWNQSSAPDIFCHKSFSCSLPHPCPCPVFTPFSIPHPVVPGESLLSFAGCGAQPRDQDCLAAASHLLESSDVSVPC